MAVLCGMPTMHGVRLDGVQSMVIGCLRLSDVSIICYFFNPRQTSQKIWGGFLCKGNEKLSHCKTQLNQIQQKQACILN